MEELTKTQLVLLVLLVSFVTSIATGIITVTLVNQAPPPITQTINKVVEKIISPVTGDSEDNENQPIIVTQDDIITRIVEDASPSVASVVASKDLPIIEQYYINPFPGDLFQDFLIPQYRQNGTERKDVSSGTGFFVSADGLLVTNKHVVEDKTAEFSVVMNDGRRLPAKVLARDPFQDIAILKIEGSNFKYLELGDSSGLKIGQSVIAIGNALGEFKNTVSVGIVSGLARSLTAQSASGAEELKNVIQTDAAINLGNSGGPLLDLHGRVIGINTAVAQQAENVGFALPINIAKRDVEDAKQFGTIKYPYIGVRYQVITAAIKEEKKLSFDYGLIIAKGPNGEEAVAKDSPAAKAGLKEGDIIMELNGIRLDKNNVLGDILARYRVGDKITLKIYRDGKEMSVDVILSERPTGI